MALFTIADDSYRLRKMARGRGGFDSDAAPAPRRRPVRIEDVDHVYVGSRKAARISDFANEDSEDLSRRSHLKDRKLLDDITTKLNKLEFENVKMDRGVSMKTGFRRHIYGQKRAPLAKETREQRRQDELKYPWDYTAPNVFRPTKKKPKNSIERAEDRKRKEKMPMWLKSERVEPKAPKDPYPVYDPLGLYRPREKREKPKDYSGCLAAKKYEDMGVREMLANMRAKAAAMPRKRDMARDVDVIMEDLFKPISRSEPVDIKVVDDYDPEWEYSRDPGLDDRTKGKLRESRGELQAFEQLLNAKFGRKGFGKGLPPTPTLLPYSPPSPPAVRAPSRVPPKVDMAANLRVLEVNSSYTEPIRVHRTGARRPPVVPGRKPGSPLLTPRRVGIRPVPSLSSRYRASSVPPVYVEEEVTTPYNFYEPPARYQPRAAQFRAQSEPPLTHSSTLAVKNARRCLDRIERELGVEDGPYVSPVHVANVTREPVVRARTAVRAQAAAGGRVPAVRRRPGSLPPPSNRTRIDQAEIERYLSSGTSSLQASPVEVNGPVPPSFVTLRSKAAEARNKMDLHKTLLDRYLPIYFGPENEVAYEVDYKYGELVDRMPGLDPYRPIQGGAGSSAVAPYTPARVSRGPKAIGGLPPKAPVNFRPEMSDTRRRIREVICHTKRDPNYYV